MWQKGKPWLAQVFGAQAVHKRNVVRRKKASVKQFASYELLIAHCKERGFHLVETGDQYIVICNDGFFKLHM